MDIQVFAGADSGKVVLVVSAALLGTILFVCLDVSK